MKLIRFRTAEGTFLAPATSVLEVRPAAQLQGLPGRNDGVAGLVEKDGRALTVLSALGARGAFLILLEQRGHAFGLLADEVLGVVEVAESAVQPAPLGQHRGLVSGLVTARGRIELVISVEALWETLQPGAGTT